MKTSASELMARLPGPPSAKWPRGERFVQAFAHGTMSVELYAPRGSDPQTPHAQDELYFIQAGRGVLVVDGTRHPFAAADCFFVPAGVAHRFEEFSSDFATWVVFWGRRAARSRTGDNGCRQLIVVLGTDSAVPPK